MTERSIDVTSVCNALMDIVVEVTDDEVRAHGLTKAQMHLVSAAEQQKLLKAIEQRSKTVELGGSSLNTIRALASLERKTVFAGAVSNDQYGKQIAKRMNDLHITNELIVTDEEPTGTCVVLVTPDSERTMVTFLGASRHFGTNIIPRSAISESKIFHFCGYQWDTAGQKEAITESIKVAKDHDCLVSFDAADAFVVEHNREAFVKLIQQDADIVFANREEAQMLFGKEKKPEAIAAEISQFGPIAVIKLDADGALICKNGEMTSINPVKTQVVDSTGAGDMFAAGFLYGQSQGRPLEICGMMAATLASDVISRRGATLSDTALAKVRSL